MKRFTFNSSETNTNDKEIEQREENVEYFSFPQYLL